MESSCYASVKIITIPTVPPWHNTDSQILAIPVGDSCDCPLVRPMTNGLAAHDPAKSTSIFPWDDLSTALGLLVIPTECWCPPVLSLSWQPCRCCGQREEYEQLPLDYSRQSAGLGLYPPTPLDEQHGPNNSSSLKHLSNEKKGKNNNNNNNNENKDIRRQIPIKTFDVIEGPTIIR